MDEIKTKIVNASNFNEGMDEIKTKIVDASNFVDKLIKAVTVLAFVLFMVSFYIYHYKSGVIYKNQVVLCDMVWSQGLTEQNPLENPIHDSFLNVKNECFNNAGRTTQFWGQLTFIALDITIILPLIYFGGKKMVKDSSDKINKVNKSL
jgi:hypothetical protein